MNINSPDALLDELCEILGYQIIRGNSRIVVYTFKESFIRPNTVQMLKEVFLPELKNMQSLLNGENSWCETSIKYIEKL